MNREYLIIDIGLGAEKVEDYDIILTEEEKELRDIRKKVPRPRKRGGVLFGMPQIWISYEKRINTRRRKRIFVFN